MKKIVVLLSIAILVSLLYNVQTSVEKADLQDIVDDLQSEVITQETSIEYVPATEDLEVENETLEIEVEEVNENCLGLEKALLDAYLPETPANRERFKEDFLDIYVQSGGNQYSIPYSGKLHLPYDEGVIIVKIKAFEFINPDLQRMYDQLRSNMTFTLRDLNFDSVGNHYELAFELDKTFTLRFLPGPACFLGVDTEEIVIEKSRNMYMGSDLYPDSNIRLEYSGGFENGGFYEVYEPKEDYIDVNIQENTAINGRIKVTLDKGVFIYETAYEGSETYVKDNNLILPEQVFLGAKWDSKHYSHEITGMDVLIQVPGGIYNCIEVKNTSDSVSGFTYYAYGVGRIKSTMYGINEELLEVIWEKR